MAILLVHRLLFVSVAFTLATTCFAQLRPMDSTEAHRRVESRGIGKSIRVNERNGTTVTGTIVAIEADSFRVKPSHGKQAVTVRNDDVVKTEKGGLSTGIKVTLYVVIGMVLLGAIAGTRV